MATLTPPQLTAATSLADGDLLVAWPVAGAGGPLKQVALSVVTDAVADGLNLGTAAQENIGTSGATVPLLSASNTWADPQTFSQGLSATGNISVDSSHRFVGALTGTADAALTATVGQTVRDASTGGALIFGSVAVAGNAPEVLGTADGVNFRPYGTGNLQVATAGTCTGNAATASTAPRLDFASGAAVDWDGTNIRFIIGGVVKGYVTPAGGFTNNV